ncbi:hypothetical protein SAMN04488038_103241 [Solimonas aquatica]|uniref:Uncharacterized protein n=1 Tax=Solimonas aquatica TaxID=489703 RepID=A0A1H9CZB5_9GAMM|nr:hypothetical protein [Solimonas aquatica]SEQ06481.1 hypothetical protein SAMN04488038_103241 [Solimonas aquatica]
MATIAQTWHEARAEFPPTPSGHHPVPASNGDGAGGVLTAAGYALGISAADATLFAESFLKSPMAKAMLERGEPLKFFLPIQLSEHAEWGGVDITIAGVRTEHVGSPREAPATDRGNGYSSNPHGPLQPGDYGVHSHPDTAGLMKNVSGED